MAWRSIFKDGRYKSYDWTIKIDLDCVFFASRMREALMPFTGHNAVSISNNGKVVSGFSRIEGPIEAFSRAAVGLYEDNPGLCETSIDASQKGEDYYIDDCMEMLGATAVYMPWELSKDPSECWDLSFVGYHPLKSRLEWQECTTASMLEWTGGNPVADHATHFSTQTLLPEHVANELPEADKVRRDHAP